MEFNPKKANILCLDINSCFATIEQQANPFLRDKPIVVAAYDSPGGCVLAASVTAKKMFGIKTGMRVSEAKLKCPYVRVVLPDPPKYRYVHKRLKRILSDYSSKVAPKSIDEFMFDLPNGVDPQSMARQIKQRIRSEVGEYITVSVGIGPNRFLAKIGSNLQKPDGLIEINKDNYMEIFSRMSLVDLTGIKDRNAARLKRIGVKTVLDFFNAPVWKLRIAFGGIGGLYWHLRLHGYEIDVPMGWHSENAIQKTYGNQYAIPAHKAGQRLQIISKLCEKTGFRLRKDNLAANGIHLAILFRKSGFWHKGMKTKRLIFETSDIYKEVLKLLNICEIDDLPRLISVSVFNVVDISNLQLSFLEDVGRKYDLSKSIDQINSKWGHYTIHYGRMSLDPSVVQDRIAFGQNIEL